ncbi:glycosyltransferase family 39 protein, partial [Candidatus Bathyarchaeota archaeon]|nr:glycosyltransferase family 39 protein [Candidatus Bathyarchaeota archaeon]
MANNVCNLAKHISSSMIRRSDIFFMIFMGALLGKYYIVVSGLSSPMWDGATYLENTRDWLANTPLFEPYRPPLISWLIACVWFFTGESWEAVKFLSVFFIMGTGIMLYATLKRHKGGLFALGVTSLTMLNGQVFFYSTQIYTEALSLFFVVATLMFVKLGQPKHWFLAGVSAGLTFASRYPILLQSVAIIAAESLTRKSWKLALRAAIGTAATVSVVILEMIVKTRTFQMALGQERILSPLLSGFYLFNSINIWG